MKTVKIIVLTILIEIALFVLFVYSGIYNVSALSADPGVIQWIFSTTSDHSVEHHAKQIELPNLNDSTMVTVGFDHYNEMCAGCHGAPGIERSEAGKGLFPEAPDLVQSAKEMPAKQLFWIVKNGIKSTGMPAFGKTHSDQKIHDIVAFLEKMKTLTPHDYANMKKTAGNEKVKM